MKILLTHRYFWPDTAPYAGMLRTIGEGLVAAGHEVQVFTTKPSYRGARNAPREESVGGVVVRRTWVLAENKRNPVVRVLNVLLFCIPLFFRILRTRPDIVTASTFPPVIEGLAAALAAQLVGAKLIYHMQDIHPEVSEHAGGLMGRTPLRQIFRWLDMHTLRRAAAIVVLSRDMADTLRARPGGRNLPIRVINNFSLDAFDQRGTPPADLAKAQDKVRVVFAGNMGRFQNLPLMAEGIGLLFDKYPQLELLLLGDGIALPELKARWGDHPQVRFHPFLPFADAQEVIRSAHLGLVSLAPGIYRVSYPSKVLTYLALGLPMLALVEPKSQLATELRELKLGAVPEVATPEAIAKALEGLLADPARLAAARAAVRAHHKAETSTEALLSRWCALVEDVA